MFSVALGKGKEIKDVVPTWPGEDQSKHPDLKPGTIHLQNKGKRNELVLTAQKDGCWDKLLSTHPAMWHFLKPKNFIYIYILAW